MKKTAILLALTITAGTLVGQVWAEPAKPTASQATTSVQTVKSERENPLVNAGIDDPKVFAAFLTKLQKAVAEDNLNEVATNMSYPLNLIKNDKKTIIYTSEQFVQKYDQIMTSYVKKKLLAQNAEDVFVNQNGIMIGEGEMWISVIDQQLAVYAIHAMENPYEVAGIDNPAEFTDFFSKSIKEKRSRSSRKSSLSRNTIRL
ncbi:hypothetical protein [Paenibacillus guangzhouensis]|uniref:hypothetical protein n=1 Tax=Paenibacillus guangzhouensis TaxID=1473112 RepID=UPI001266AB9E|nr:hypothetical protein [Paenibacillus guangzhouensis]